MKLKLEMSTSSGAPRPRHCGENEMSLTPNLLGRKILIMIRIINMIMVLGMLSDGQIVHSSWFSLFTLLIVMALVMIHTNIMMARMKTNIVITKMKTSIRMTKIKTNIKMTQMKTNIMITHM